MLHSAIKIDSRLYKTVQKNINNHHKNNCENYDPCTTIQDVNGRRPGGHLLKITVVCPQHFTKKTIQQNLL